MAQFGDFTVDRNSTKYVLGSGGKIISYATDEPAFEFNADGSYKGLLVEPAATNICKQSEDISTTWTASGDTTVTANDTTAPDGNSTADKLGDNGLGGTGTDFVYVNQAITVVAETKYTGSFFVKADGLSFCALTVLGITTGGANADQFFGLSGAGTVGSLSGNLDNATIEAYPNDWYRCSITWTQGAGDTSVSFRIYVANSISSVAVDGDGTSSIFVWGAQVEASPIATSYIPTTTASVTRVKDDITLGSASSLIGQTEGTLYVEVDWRLATGVSQYLLEASDNSGNNRILIYNDGGTVKLTIYVQANGGSPEAQQGVSSTGFSGIQKIAFAYKTDDFELYRNGSSISSSTSGSLAALGTLTDIDLGQRFDAIEQANMWIRAVALYPKRLSDAECEALTTL